MLNNFGPHLNKAFQNICIWHLLKRLKADFVDIENVCSFDREFGQFILNAIDILFLAQVFHYTYILLSKIPSANRINVREKCENDKLKLKRDCLEMFHCLPS